MADDYIRVRVTASQTVHYDQVLKFTPKEWAEFKAMDEEAAGDELADRLDGRSINDADPIEGGDFIAFVVGPDKKPIEPRDEYRDR